MRQWINFYYYLRLERYEAHVLTVELGKEAMTDAQELFDVYQRALGILNVCFQRMMRCCLSSILIRVMALIRALARLNRI